MQYRMVWAGLFGILLLLLPVTAGAAPDNSLAPNCPASDSSLSDISQNLSPSVHGTESFVWVPLSGTTRFFRDTLPAGTPRYWMDITWNDPYRDLRVTVFSPDGLVGTYANTANGRVDGRIFLEMEQDSGLPYGNWYYVVKTDPDTNYTVSLYQNRGG